MHSEDESKDTALPDAVLAQQAKTDPDAFGQLYDRHYDTILRYLFRRTLDKNISEELTANTFFKAFKAIKKYKPQKAFLAWLYGIAINELRMHWRHKKRNSPEIEARRWKQWAGLIEFTEPNITDSAEQEMAMDRYAAMLMRLQQLPEKYQSVLSLRYIEGMTNQEISDVLQCRPGTIKSQIHRGLKRLRKLLETTDATNNPVRH